MPLTNDPVMVLENPLDYMTKMIAENKALKACVESHERTIKTLKDDIQRRIKADDSVVTMYIADMPEVRKEVSKVCKRYFHDDDIDRVAESCFEWMKYSCKLSKDYVADTVRDWWEEEGADEFFGKHMEEAEPEYAPKSDTE